ncbi:MAG: pilus assembly protein [Anaerolineae bacterium]|nr:pilus assembly protein [Anaerolineae bacterium]
MFKLKNHNRSTGQALVEFALMAVILLMIIFLIIEAARILWAWGTVQNAAREGARYAVTGEFDRMECAVISLDKFNDPLCGESGDFRVASVISVTHRGLAGLPLNETSGTFEDDEYYNIEVWGADISGQIRGNFAGVPNAPVIVRAYYRVPIITPFFRPILSSIPVFGQAIMYNESFGQLGSGSNQGAALPPPISEFPTVGVTPSPTFTPTPDPSTNTPVPSATFTPTATDDFCHVKFDGAAIAGSNIVYITGEVGTLVRIVNLTTGGDLISDNYPITREFDGHACPGFVTVFLNGPLVNGHSIAVESSDGSVDITFVLPGTPTPTATQTSTVTSTPEATATLSPITPTPSITPKQPYIVAIPNCGSLDTNGNVSIQVFGYNWPDETVVFYWQQAGEYRDTDPKGHGGIISGQWLEKKASMPTDPTKPNVYNILAYSTSVQVSTQYKIPCDNATPVPTVTATPTHTPVPADLIVVGPPQLVSSPPIIGYEPVQFSVVISNTGDVNVDNNFYVDLYLDPNGPIGPSDVRIPINQSSGYVGLSGLPGKTSRVITITAPFGFENEPDPHAVYGMVDSIEEIGESIETNNISAMATADYVIPGDTPTPSPTPPNGTNLITGKVNWTSPDGLDNLNRALVRLYNSSGVLVDFTQTNASGVYTFKNVPGPETYAITACGNLDGDRYGVRSNISIPNTLPIVNIFTNLAPCP